MRQALRIFEGSEDKFTAGQVYYYLSKMELMRGTAAAYKELIQKSLEIFNTIGANDWKEKAEKVSEKRPQ